MFVCFRKNPKFILLEALEHHSASTRCMLSRASFHTRLHHFTVRSTQRGFMSATPFIQKFGFLNWEHQPGWSSRASFRLKSINQVYALQSIIWHISSTPFHSFSTQRGSCLQLHMRQQFDFRIEWKSKNDLRTILQPYKNHRNALEGSAYTCTATWHQMRFRWIFSNPH